MFLIIIGIESGFYNFNVNLDHGYVLFKELFGGVVRKLKHSLECVALKNKICNSLIIVWRIPCTCWKLWTSNPDRDHLKPPTLSYFWVHFGSKIFCLLFSVLVLVHPKMGLLWYHESQKDSNEKHYSNDTTDWYGTGGTKNLVRKVRNLTPYRHQKYPLGCESPPAIPQWLETNLRI